MSLFVSKAAMDVFLDRQIANCHGYYGNKKEIYKEALLAVKSFAKTENCIEAEPVVHGYWKSNDPYVGWSCSVCNKNNDYAYNWDYEDNKYILQDKFCPNCGAKMDEVEE